MPETLHARVTAQLKLALLGDCGCHKTLAKLEREARQSGLTGAEIDAAIIGRSFEARTAAAVSFACALKAGKGEALAQARTRALQLGINDAELREIAEGAKRILAAKKL
jgi:hypothetical protein